MAELAYHDFRSFIEEAKKVSDYRLIEGADWDGEIGALVESTAELVPQPPMLLFDKVKGYPAGFRVCSLPYAAYKRVALALGLPTDKPKLEILRLAARKVSSAKPIAPREVSTSPLFENVLKGDDVNLLKFPALRFHENDGGRYFAPGGGLINRDSDSGYVNTGTYRMQLHDKKTLGLWMSPGQNGRQICAQYWEQGKSCPVVATYGQHPLVFMPSYTKFPYGSSEMEISGGLIGKPLEVLRGPITGLPIPASSEIAIEGEVPPPSEEARDEGPFGEWPGYYSGGTLGTGDKQPIIRVKAIYHRNDPILEDEAPLWPGAVKMDLHISAGVLWDQLESAGIQDIVGVYNHTSYLTVVSIKQKYAGHAKQAGLGRCERRCRGAQWPLRGRCRRGYRSDQPERSDVGDDDAGGSSDEHRHHRRLLEHTARSADASGQTGEPGPHQQPGNLLRRAAVCVEGEVPQSEPLQPRATGENDCEV